MKVEILLAVRFIDPETLVLHQPYEMTYMGELIVSNPPSSTLQMEVSRTAERQIFEITNLYRQKFNVPVLINDYDLTVFARKHSEKMALEIIPQKSRRILKNLLIVWMKR